MAITDDQGDIVQRYSYEAFGQLTYVLDPTFDNFYTYTGREYDKETGLYYYRARYYDAMEGRFISKDPIGFAGGDVNLYNYVGGNPINYVDPSGLAWFRPDDHKYVVGRPGVQYFEPGHGIVGFIDDYVPAGHTFGANHDAFVGWAKA